jgi:GTPase
MAHKAGFVNIIGRPNAGKSTLMNILVGERLSIITNKAQTTRHRILGIVNEEDFQIVYSDTPGILKPHYQLQEAMLKAVHEALEDADLFLWVADIAEPIPDAEEEIVKKLNGISTPLILLVNKIDTSHQEQLEKVLMAWAAIFPKAEILPISATEKFNIDSLKRRIVHLLPEAPPYFDKDQLTNRSERFFVSEIIREKILLHYDKEVPYSCEVVVTEFKEEAEIVRIRAEIYVNRESQKAILIGHQGSRLKKVGTDARKDIETFIQQKVFLELYVKVSKDWRDNPLHLKRFGYLD